MLGRRKGEKQPREHPQEREGTSRFFSNGGEGGEKGNFPLLREIEKEGLSFGLPFLPEIRNREEGSPYLTKREGSRIWESRPSFKGIEAFRDGGKRGVRGEKKRVCSGRQKLKKKRGGKRPTISRGGRGFKEKAALPRSFYALEGEEEGGVRYKSAYLF